MRPFTFVNHVFLKHPKSSIIEWQLAPQSFARSFPPWEKCTILSTTELPGRQSRVVATLQFHAWKTSYVFRIFYPRSGVLCRTTLEKGPLKNLDVTVSIKNGPINTYELIEKVECSLKFPWFFPKKRGKWLQKRFKRFYEYKHAVIENDVTLLEKIRDIPRQKILVSGSSGLIGSHLVDFLEIMGHQVFCLKRKKEEIVLDNEILFDPIKGDVYPSQLEGFDAVIHLAGSSIQGRWTNKKKQAMLQSRAETTKRLVSLLLSLEKPPKVFLSASAVGFYGDRSDLILDEQSQKGADFFLSDVCKMWEDACLPLIRQKVRVGHMRFGIVLTMKGGALRKLFFPANMGLGATFGSGKQYMSWIAIDDLISAMHHTLLTESLSGPINFVSPNPVTNKEFLETLTKHIKRPLRPPIPKSILKITLGQMAEELLLSSTRVVPKKLLESGYKFLYPHLEDALKHLVF